MICADFRWGPSPGSPKERPRAPFPSRVKTENTEKPKRPRKNGCIESRRAPEDRLGLTEDLSGLPWATPRASRPQKTYKNQCFFNDFKVPPRTPESAPRTPRGRPEAPWEPPRHPQGPPRGPPSAPRGPPSAPRVPTRAPWEAPRSPEDRPRPSKSDPEAALSKNTAS